MIHEAACSVLVILFGAMAVSSLGIPPSLSSVFGPLFSMVPSFSSASIDAPAYRTAAVEPGDVVATVQAAGTLNALVMVEVGSRSPARSRSFTPTSIPLLRRVRSLPASSLRSTRPSWPSRSRNLRWPRRWFRCSWPKSNGTARPLRTPRPRRNSAKAQTTRAEVALDDAAQELERKRPLAQLNIVAAGDWQRVQNAHRSAQAQVTASRALKLSQAAAIAPPRRRLRWPRRSSPTHWHKLTKASGAPAGANRRRPYLYSRARHRHGGQPRCQRRPDRRGQPGDPTLFTIAQDLTQMQVEASVVEADVSRLKSVSRSPLPWMPILGACSPAR